VSQFNEQTKTILSAVGEVINDEIRSVRADLDEATRAPADTTVINRAATIKENIHQYISAVSYEKSQPVSANAGNMLGQRPIAKHLRVIQK
jgi:hypothetical protein